ncbi:NAD(P)-dependent dehydrogenase (short-subunit alcohol dehydrogenase family) [Paenibacillus sp. V4I3]|nr:NAD(P)-dependent dehydrogenase (short-subunit alcohol dehydrogenase family) [Paenibacillus sp. V4I3]
MAIITGGESGIGRAISYLFAKEGADIVVVYLNEHGDAAETKARVEQIGRRCLTIAGGIFTRSLALSLLKRGICVNAVTPGRTWTPLIPASLPLITTIEAV